MEVDNIHDIRRLQGKNAYLRTRTRMVRMDNEQPKTMSVPAAGKKYFGLGKNGSYDAAKRGEIPTLKFGSRLRVPVVALDRMLADAGSKSR
jgi:hypothetical protein